jgi:L-threonylcarbamoyladenylate synthase
VTSRSRIDRAARCIIEGGVIAYPTEAVYGIGCLPFDIEALERVMAIKRRDARKGLIVVAADISQLEPIAVLPGGETGSQMRGTWPGPVSWVVAARPGLPALLTGGRPTVAVRVSAHPVVQQLCRRSGSALVSTSANCSGHRPARSALAVRRTLGTRLDYVLAGPVGGAARPSEIRDAATGRLLRPG